MQTNLIPQGVSGSNIKNADKLAARACEACRIRKIRCLQDRSFSDVSCKPCLFANRACVYADPSLRKRRKRTDARVAELEKTVKALSTALNGGVGSDSTVQRNLETKGDLLQERMFMETAAPKIPTTFPKLYESFPVDGLPHRWSSSRSAQDEIASLGMRDNAQFSPQSDVVSRGLLSMIEATFLFDMYVNQMSPHSSDVILPADSTANTVRRETPVLFLAVITAASSTVDGRLNSRLTTELRQAIADRVFMNGGKSVKLVQALLITTSWSYPSDKYDEAKFYQLVHMTATMALEIGLGKKPGDSSFSTPPEDHDDTNSTSVRSVKGSWHSTSVNGLSLTRNNSEGCRAIVSCYIKCSGVSLGLCRPSMLPFSEWISECIDMLDCSWNAPPANRRLAAWARLAHVMEEFRNAFAFDVSNITVSLGEPRIRHMLRSFNDQLDKLRASFMPDVMDQSLEIYYHYCKIHMHTIALYSYYDEEEFQPPYLVRTSVEPSRFTDLPAAYIDALSICTSAAQDLLNTFLQTEGHVLRLLPTVGYVRMTYAITILIKLSVAATSFGGGNRNSINLESLEVSHYLEELASYLSIAAGQNQSRVAIIFSAIIARLKSWYGQEQRVELCQSCYLIKQESNRDIADLSQNGPLDFIARLENTQATVDPITSVLTMQCLYTPSCSTVYAPKADSQATPFSFEPRYTSEQSLDPILATNITSTSQTDDFFDCPLNMDWPQILLNDTNDLPTEHSSGWVLDDLRT